MSLSTPPFQERATPESFREPFSGALYDRGYGSMPALPFKNQEVIKRQDGVEKEFYKLFAYPPADLNVPDDFKEMFQADYEIGERLRHLTNHNNYMSWLATEPRLTSGLQAAQARFEDGRAEVDDVLDLSLAHRNPFGFEVGRATVAYWQRMHLVPEMREAVANAVLRRGGILEPRIIPYRSIDILPRLDTDHTGIRKIIGFIALYKHDIAYFERENGVTTELVERQIAGIRVDEASGFRQDILENMTAISCDDPGFDWSLVTHQDFEDNLRTSGARGFIEKAIQSDSTADFMVPESTTVYVVDVETQPESEIQPLGRFRMPDRDNGIAYYNSNPRKAGR